jgi:tetratricopeptide (TPR) repeat protein
LKLVPLIALIILTLNGCGGKGQITISPAETSPAKKPLSPSGYNHFVNANLLEIFGAYQEAIREYEKALIYFPESATIRTDYARLLFRLSRIPESLEQALLIEPKSSDINLLIGDCYRMSDNMEVAVTYYQKAVELDADNVNAYWHLAGYFRRTNQPDSVITTYYQLARLLETDRIWSELGTWLSAADRFDEAEKAFLQAIELNPDTTSNSRAWLELGILRGRAERYDESRAAFEKSIKLVPDKSNIGAYLGLAATYDALDSISRAEELYDKAIKLSPDDVRIYRQMLAMYLGHQNIKKSIEVSVNLVALVPSDWAAQRRLGILLYSDDQLDRADSLFSSRIDFGDDDILNFFYRGRVALEQERQDDALYFFKEVTAKEPSFGDGWLNLGFIYSGKDSLETAINTYRDGLSYVQHHEDSIRLYFALGAALERNDQFYEAVNTFKELIEKEKDHAPALNYLGYMLADRGEQLLYALELIEQALKLSPGNGAYIDSYAWVQYKLGNYDVALAELKRAVALLDNDAVIHEHIGDVYKAIGNLGEAERSYQRALEIDPESIIIEEKLKE